MARKYMKHTKETDSIITKGMESRGNNSQTTAAKKIRQELFKATGQKFSTSAVCGRYWTIKAQAKSTTPKTPDVRQQIVDLLMTRENVTLEIRGKEITAVFK
tara:strand:- start:7193 stop:7498 length:306 start_codon:yes stop_codon:yes gene_type:complete